MKYFKIALILSLVSFGNVVFASKLGNRIYEVCGYPRPDAVCANRVIVDYSRGIERFSLKTFRSIPIESYRESVFNEQIEILGNEKFKSLLFSNELTDRCEYKFETALEVTVCLKEYINEKAEIYKTTDEYKNSVSDETNIVTSIVDLIVSGVIISVILSWLYGLFFGKDEELEEYSEIK